MNAANVESTGSAPSVPLLGHDVSSGSGLLRLRSVSPGGRFSPNENFRAVTQQSSIAHARTRRTLPTLSQHFSALQTQFTQATAPLCDHVVHTSEVVQKYRQS